MSNCNSLILAGCALVLSALPVRAQKSQDGKPEFLHGPATAKLGNIAEIKVPEGFMFTGADGTKKLMEMMGNFPSGTEVGFLSPTSMVWFVVFEYDDVGYVKDDDKDKLDADKILESVKQGTEQANKARKKMGIPALNVTGWEQPPKYNPESNNLEWAIRAESEGKPVVNYNTRVLGRKGVMQVTVVGDPEEVKTAMPEFKQLMTGYSFGSGQTYAEYKSGDKVAKYGLAALVVGGAAVGAAKLGLLGGLLVFLKKAWYLVVAAVVGVVSFIKKLLGRMAGGRRNSGTME